MYGSAMSAKPCGYPPCDRAAYAKGLCDAHRKQQLRGSTLHPIGAPKGVAAGPPRARRERWLKPNGYVAVPSGGVAQSFPAWDYEHRVVMRRMLGRDLLPGESVHHRNGDKTDNRPENLELWLRHQPAGQRVSDMLAWAREIIARYDDVEG